MEKEPFKNRTLGGRLVRDSVTASVMPGFTCFMRAEVLTCMPLRETEQRIIILSTSSRHPGASLCGVPLLLSSSFERSASNCPRGLRVVLVRDTSAICKSNQTHVGLRISARTCQPPRRPRAAHGARREVSAIYLRR